MNSDELKTAEELYLYAHKLTNGDPDLALSVLLSCSVQIINTSNHYAGEERASVIKTCIDLIKEGTK